VHNRGDGIDVVALVTTLHLTRATNANGTTTGMVRTVTTAAGT
jgi:hypothetical protein